MTTGPSPSEPRSDPGKEDRAGPEPNDLLRRAELRAEREVRDFVRELPKQAAKGAAFHAGKEIAKEIWRLLTETYN